jgi:imidazolonepropionase-like amidohydrolase
LNLWTTTTPQAIFPDRRIGRLDAGYEASFLVLGGNPLDDFSAVRTIRRRVKQGHELGAPAS